MAELNHIEEVLACVVLQDTPEGRFGLLTTHGVDYDFGSRADLPGFKLPATAAEAARARFMVNWSYTNQQMPMYLPEPAMPFALRQGFGTSDNTPFTATVYVTPPSVQGGVVIPSGVTALAFGAGIYTLDSSGYINDANLLPGAAIKVADAATDGASNAGKLKYASTVDSSVIGFVVKKDSDGRLTVKINM